MIGYSIGPAGEQAPMGGQPFNRSIAPDDTVWIEFFRVPEGYLLRFPGLADYTVTHDGTVVTAHPTPATDAATLEHLYVNQVFPLALSRQGRPAFHASVVTVAGGAIAFLGSTGMGKSTLATSFVRNGAEFLTDDGMLIEERDEGIFVQPNHPSVRLWDDSIAVLLGDDAARAPALSFTSKSRLLASDALPYCDHPKPLLAAFVLGDDSAPVPTVGDLNGVDRVMGWLANSFLLDGEDRALISRHFEWTLRISGRVPTWRLDYPRRYDVLPQVRALVLDQLVK